MVATSIKDATHSWVGSCRECGQTVMASVEVPGDDKSTALFVYKAIRGGFLAERLSRQGFKDRHDKAGMWGCKKECRRRRDYPANGVTLWTVRVSVDVAVHAESEEEAEEIALANAGDEIDRAGADAFLMTEADAKEFGNCIPWGDTEHNEFDHGVNQLFADERATREMLARRAEHEALQGKLFAEEEAA